MKKPPADILKFLDRIGATETSHHAGRSLTEHLTGTWNLLTGWNLPDHVAIAGLCHSVYGTDAFESACLGPDDRHQVHEAIGEDAERVSFLFGALDREKFLDDLPSLTILSRFDGSKISLTQEDRTALCDILFANEMDLVFAKKGRDRPDKVVKKVGPIYSVLEPYLSPVSIAFYAQSTSAAS